MLILIRTILLTALLTMAANSLWAQPFDLIIPTADSPDSLSKELRKLQSFERDMAIEKLTREPTRLEAYIELAELRRSQGKLVESQRFYEMALEMDPDNPIANQGLAMVHYYKGEFNLAKKRVDLLHKFYPLSDDLDEDLKNLRRNLMNEVQLGATIREDDRGLSEFTTSAEIFVPSDIFPKVTARYRFENWTHEDNGINASTQIYSSTFDYTADKNTSFSLTYSPEIFPGGEVMTGYQGQLITGTDNMKIAARLGKTTFRENLHTVNNRYYEEYGGASLFGDLHRRTRIIQSVMIAELSDGNQKQRYDSELVHCVYRNELPFITANLRFYQLSFEQQADATGAPLRYWSPLDFKGAELTLSWERRVGANWWWGIDTNYNVGQQKFFPGDNQTESGLGATLQVGYRFDKGNLFISIGERMQDYYRERRLEAYGSLEF